MGAEAKPLTSEVIEVRARIDAWRKVRKGGSKMPEDLWGEAATLAQHLGIWRVSQALGVCDRALSRRVKERINKSGDTKVREKSHAELVGFVELGSERFPGNLSAGPVLELTGPTGTRLMIRLTPGSMLDVAGLMGILHGWRG